MPSFADLALHSGAHVWLFMPIAVLLGALHGLEPGHSKTMMAAFIVAVRGTVGQAILLGLSAAISHTALVWIVALGGRFFAGGYDAAASEPYFQLASAVIILAIATWMLWRAWREHAHHDVQHGHAPREHEHYGHAPYDHVHLGHADHHHHGHDHAHADVDALGGHAHDHRHRAHSHHHGGEPLHLPHTGDTAHERAHARDIESRFAGGAVTTRQIVLFGLTGGLIPCPAAVTVLLLCLQLKRLALAVVLVLCFSIGVAATMVAAGVIAALGLRHVRRRWSGFDAAASRAPYASGAMMVLVALYMAFSALVALNAGHMPSS